MTSSCLLSESSVLYVRLRCLSYRKEKLSLLFQKSIAILRLGFCLLQKKEKILILVIITIGSFYMLENLLSFIIAYCNTLDCITYYGKHINIFYEKTVEHLILTLFFKNKNFWGTFDFSIKQSIKEKKKMIVTL